MNDGIWGKYDAVIRALREARKEKTLWCSRCGYLYYVGLDESLGWCDECGGGVVRPADPEYPCRRETHRPETRPRRSPKPRCPRKPS